MLLNYTTESSYAFGDPNPKRISKSGGRTFKNLMKGFPRGAVVKNLPANAGDTGSSPGPGRSHMAVEQLSPCTTTTEPVL